MWCRAWAGGGGLHVAIGSGDGMPWPYNARVNIHLGRWAAEAHRQERLCHQCRRARYIVPLGNRAGLRRGPFAGGDGLVGGGRRTGRNACATERQTDRIYRAATRAEICGAFTGDERRRKAHRQEGLCHERQKGTVYRASTEPARPLQHAECGWRVGEQEKRRCRRDGGAATSGTWWRMETFGLSPKP